MTCGSPPSLLQWRKLDLDFSFLSQAKSMESQHHKLGPCTATLVFGAMPKRSWQPRSQSYCSSSFKMITTALVVSTGTSRYWSGSPNVIYHSMIHHQV
eukprot:scaffold1046_cov136-Skeletonema_dohrnii-CCMP3373.AAC.5